MRSSDGRRGADRKIEEHEFVALDPTRGAVILTGAPDPAQTIVIGATVVQLPTPYVRSFVRLCRSCGEPIWLAGDDPAMARLLAAGAETACVDCAQGSGFTPAMAITSTVAFERANLRTRPTPHCEVENEQQRCHA